MNTNTKLNLKRFISQVQVLAQGTVHMIGAETASEIIKVGEELKVALDSDETILESR